MDTGPPPPPPPPPLPLLLSGNQAQNTRPTTPQPGFAAIPFNKCPPTQETNPPPEALHDAQDEENPPLLQVDEPLSMAPDGQEDSDSDAEEKKHPVQETNPAPQALHDAQMTEEQDEGAAPMEPAGDDQQA